MAFIKYKMIESDYDDYGISDEEAQRAQDAAYERIYNYDTTVKPGDNIADQVDLSDPEKYLKSEDIDRVLNTEVPCAFWNNENYVEAGLLYSVTGMDQYVKEEDKSVWDNCAVLEDVRIVSDNPYDQIAADLGEEVLEEEIPAEQTFNSDDVAQVLSDYYDDGDAIYDTMLADFVSMNTELTGDQVDTLIAKYIKDPALISEVEDKILALSNPREERLTEFKDALKYDIESLEDLELTSIAANTLRNNILEQLKDWLNSNPYNGDEDIVFNVKDAANNSNKRVLDIE